MQLPLSGVRPPRSRSRARRAELLVHPFDREATTLITCQELDGVVERLCDLTREMPELERVAEATSLLDDAETTTRRFLMQWRAAAVADLHYLQGMSLRKIAQVAGTGAFQAPSQWLQAYGPTHYLLVVKRGRQRAEFKVIAVEESSLTRKKIRSYRDAGYRVVPATRNMLDGAEIRAGADAEQLWRQLGQVPAGA